MIDALVSIILMTIVFACGLRVVYLRGYKAGAKMILGEWKKMIDDMGDDE